MGLIRYSDDIFIFGSKYPIARIVTTFDIDDKPPLDYQSRVTVEHLTGKMTSVEQFSIPRLWEGDYG